MDEQHFNEKMIEELETFRELAWEIKIANRLKRANASNVRYSLQEVMGMEEYEKFQAIDPDSIADEDLFE